MEFSVTHAGKAKPTVYKRNSWKKIFQHWELYLFMLPAILYFLIFHYVPMYGVQIAFKDFIARKGIWDSPWVGLEHFIRFVQSYFFPQLMKNTLLINLLQLCLFPLPILMALSLNELKTGRLKKWIQTITYAPHFISVVVMSGMIITFLNPSSGIVNIFLAFLGYPPIDFMASPEWFKTIYVLSGEWQNLGWGAIVYLAALASIDPQLYEASKVDGASRIQRIWHINLPLLLPTAIILLLLNMGHFMTVGFEKVLLLQNNLNMSSSDVIQTYVYRSGVLQSQYGFSSAVGLFNSVVNLVLLLAFNKLARKVSETSLW